MHGGPVRVCGLRAGPWTDVHSISSRQWSELTKMFAEEARGRGVFAP